MSAEIFVLHIFMHQAECFFSRHIEAFPKLNLKYNNLHSKGKVSVIGPWKLLTQSGIIPNTAPVAFSSSVRYYISVWRREEDHK